MMVNDRTIDGVFNFRDLGGHVAEGRGTTRFGLLFRADGLHRASASGRQALADLGLRLVIDLRASDELEAEGRFAHEQVAFRHVAIIERLTDILEAIETGVDDILRHHYRELLEENASAFANTIELIADSLDQGSPAVFHCTAGKDRTGVIAALVLAGIGVDDRSIADDYSRSGPAMKSLARWYREQGGTPEERMRDLGLDPSLAAVLMRAEQSTMLGTLDDIRAGHGSVGAFLDSLGVGPAVDRIARRLLTS